MRKMTAQKIKSKYYDKVIQINVPIRFYWAKCGFDGIEFGPFDKPVPPYQIHLIYEVLDEIRKIMGTELRVSKTRLPKKIVHIRESKPDNPTQIPQVYIDAFRGEKGHNGE